MAIIIIIVVLVIFFYIFSYCVTNKVRIHWNTFLHKGFKAFEDDYGLYCFYAVQGGGKTFSIIDILTHYIGKKKIYTNVRSFYEKHKKEVIFENDLKNLVRILLAEQDCSNILVYYDEIFSALSETRIDEDTKTLLTQLRKRRLHFFTSSQLWSELPIQFRRLCRYEVSCKFINIPLFNFSILINEFNDGYNITWDKDSNSFSAPRLWTTIKKCNKSVAESYDTLETVSHKSTPFFAGAGVQSSTQQKRERRYK